MNLLDVCLSLVAEQLRVPVAPDLEREDYHEVGRSRMVTAGKEVTGLRQVLLDLVKYT